MNNDWRKELKVLNDDIYTRLCECRNTTMDFILMCNLLLRYNPSITSEEAYEYMFEWCCDYNGQMNLANKLDTNYKWVMSRIHR